MNSICDTCSKEINLNIKPIVCINCKHIECNECYTTKSCNTCIQLEKYGSYEICSNCFSKLSNNIDVFICVGCKYGIGSCCEIKSSEANLNIHACDKRCLERVFKTFY